MSPVWSSHGVVLATAMAISGTMIIFSLLRSTTTCSDRDRDSSSSEASSPPPPPPSPQRRRSCLSSVKKDGSHVKKKVRFAESVKEADRKAWREVEYVVNCGIETMEFNGARNLLVDFSR